MTTTTTPNMGLILPTPGSEPGPTYASDNNSAFTLVDSHNHSAGQGVQVPTAGLIINADLTYNGYNATQFRSVRYNSQSSALNLAADVNCVYVTNGNLYFNDINSNQIQLTAAGAVNTSSSGNITGMGATTATVVYTSASSKFSFYSNTNVPAYLYTGPIILGVNSASPKTITIAPNAGQSANYSLTFPAAAPATGQILSSDSSGNFSWVTDAIGRLPIGSVVASFPNLTGAYSCTATTVADAAGFVKCNGQTIADGTSPMNGQVVPNLNNTVFLAGSTTAGTSAGAATVTLSTANLAAHTHDMGHGHAFSVATVASATHTHSLATGQACIGTGGTNNSGDLYIRQASTITGSFTATSHSLPASMTTSSFSSNLATVLIGSSDVPSATSATTVTDQVGNTGSTGSATSFSILPTYISTLYIQRIK